MTTTPTSVRSRRRLLTRTVLLALLALALAACSTPDDKAPDTRMVPWRGADGQFGFSTRDEQLLIEPRFQTARPGNHGFAPVATAKDRWGLVDAHGHMALDFDYAAMEFIDTPYAALVVTKTEYNAWWRVWEWRLWPEFNILSTSHNGPTLTTRVPRAVWRVYDPATGETLYESDRPDDKKGGADSQYWRDDWEPERHRPRDLRIDHWPDGAVVIDNTLYADSGTGRLSAVAHDIRDRLAGGDFLQRIDDKRHRRTDANGQATDAPVYTERYGVPFETEDGESITVPRSNVFEDEAGRFYLFPDLSHPLPTTLADYRFADGTRLAARDFAGTNVATFMPVPNSPWFALVSRVTRTGQTEPGKTLTFLFDGDGRWCEGFYCMLADGRMLFRYTEPYGVLAPNLTFEPLPMAAMGRGALGPHRYAGTDSKDRKGVYDSENRRSVFRAANIAIDSLPLAPGRVGYRAKNSEGKSVGAGLLDSETGYVAVPPIYGYIKDDGHVLFDPDDGEPMHFYIDLQSGREYRDGAAQRPADES
ncbi:Twin arginine translocation signal domain containing protein [Salinisphaera shabanensis E1L3A]|uniref:Twin arginine translocation signal domain containing protein n=1 Tax=Salinisphaera shabanensis E1L3A TaxID=1033802 RepID=U2EPH8_9GAMM|nr:hypothetical protein [Salinisphaera shabanensis]ERJ19992.1 Twin arginine translocation signal domain containing protein [Salinisphaera shabanensis E1L3A]